MGYNDGVLKILQFTNDSGVPYSQPKLYHYESGGGTVLKDIYEDAERTIPLAQPFVGTTGGRFEFYMDPGDDYHLVAWNNGETLKLFDKDPVRVTHGNPLIEPEDHGIAAPSTPTTDNLNHFYGKIDGDGNLVDLLYCHNEASPEYVSAISTVLAEQGIEDLVTKYPSADIRYFGACVSIADNRTYIQAAVDFLDGEGGGELLIPPGTFKAKNVNLKNNIQVRGFGHSAILQFPDSGVEDNDYIMKGDDLTNVDIRDLWFDGNGTTKDTILLEIFNDTGSHSHMTIKGCHFENQAGGVAVKLVGSAVNQLCVADINSPCHFHDLNDGIYILYADQVKVIGNNFTGLTGTPIKLDESSFCIVADNTISNWNTTKPGIHLDDTSHTEVRGNIVPATSGDPEAYGILDEENDGTSELNDINHNDVTGGFTAEPIEVHSGTTIVWFNRGSTISQGGQSPDPAGGLEIDDFFYTNLSGTTTSSETGKIKDTGVVFPDHVCNPRDLLWFESEPNQLWYSGGFPIDNEVTIDTSTVRSATATVVSIGKSYKNYNNIRVDETDGQTYAVADGDVWLNIGSVDIDDAGAPAATDTITIEAPGLNESNEAPIRVDVWGNNGTGAHQISQLSFDYADITDRIVADGSEDTNHTNLITTFWLLRKSGSNDLTMKLIGAGATCKIRVNAYRRL
jgi:parallel beta-helix repeat protein